MAKYFSFGQLNPHNFTINDEQMVNLNLLMGKLDSVREVFGKPMIVTSGLRDAVLQVKVNPLNLLSNHLKGLAADIHDEGGILLAWVLQHLDFMKELGFFFEHPNWTPTWLHFQPVSPHSGKRFFIPNSSPPLCHRWDGIYDNKYDLVIN